LSVSVDDVKRLAKKLLLVLSSFELLELILLLADSLDDERRLPTEEESVGRAAGATNAVLADELPMLAMESTVASIIIVDFDDNDE